MKIFVTGADGFIGSHLVERLVKNKYKVTALCLYNTNSSIGSMTNIKKNILKKVKIIFGDIRDMTFVNDIVKKNDLVINLAALISIP
jgi:nucleoside-diphosphate-sugar epimerase